MMKKLIRTTPLLLERILPGLIIFITLLFNSTSLAFHKPHWLERLSGDNKTQASTFWSQMGQDFAIECDLDNPNVQRHIRWYQEHPKHLQKILKSSEPFIHYVYEQTQRHHLPAELALIPLLESQYNPSIGAPSGAAGLWQMMPGTATKFGLKINHTYDGRRDVSASTQAALQYLSYLYRYFNHDWLLALAAYDAGEGKIASVSGRRHLNFWSLPLSRETKEYVPRLLAVASIIKQPEQYNLRLPTMTPEATLQEMTWNEAKVINLTEAAKALGVEDSVLRRYNPGIRKNVANIPSALTLLIPTDAMPQTAIVKTELTNPEVSQSTEESNIPEPVLPLKQQQEDSILHHKIKKGETLASLAKRYHCPVAKIKKLNHLTTTKLKIGKTLLIPNTTHVDELHETTKQKVHDAPNSTQVVKQPQQKTKHKGQNRIPNTSHAAKPPHPTSKQKAHNRTYVIRSGDNLVSIAKKVHLPVKQLKSLNHIKNEKQLKIGHTLSY
jgi:membrane-bound lytic murein transglycosylase D